MLGKSLPAGAPNPTATKRALRLRNLLRVPAALLLFAGGAALYPNLPRLAMADAASVPAVAALAAAPAAVPAVAHATASRAVPAVFSQGADGLSPKVLAAALDAVSCARARGVASKGDLLTVIDYSLPSTQPRLWVLDLAHGKVLFHQLVAHGAGSGDNYATRFSNRDDSRQTSLGLFLTGDTYEGGNGYSLRLKGLDRGVNDRAEERHIVMHGAWYVSADHARQFGRIGRSWGCPALPAEMAKPVIDLVKGGSFLYSYAPAQVSTAALHACAASPAPNGGTASGGGTVLASTK